jgi:hypothetical protein
MPFKDPKLPWRLFLSEGSQYGISDVNGNIVLSDVSFDAGLLIVFSCNLLKDHHKLIERVLQGIQLRHLDIYEVLGTKK